MGSEQSVKETLRELLSSYGLDILFSSVQLTGLLRDLHPQEPQKVFCILETIESGVLESLLNCNPTREAELRSCAALLTSRSGIQASLALWAIQVWSEVLPKEIFSEQKISRKVDALAEDDVEKEIWNGTIDEILGRPEL
ncbi:MAG: hypothetical protein CMK59_14055 [Proteobacteria bacterium]|nr:hypothetical protein [Pseudomonadota bacterium]